MKRSDLTAISICAFFVIFMILGMRWVWLHPRKSNLPAAYSRGQQCSDDGKTWWPARVENGTIMCYMVDKPRAETPESKP